MSDEMPLSDVVDEVARGAAAVEFDGVKVQQHSLKDLDEVASRKAASKAVRKPNRGVFFNKLVPGGAND